MTVGADSIVRCQNNNYSAPRVRRKLRPPLLLAAWLEAIFNSFGPLRCSKTRKPLLPPKERNKAAKVIDAIKAGYICDLEGNFLSFLVLCSIVLSCVPSYICDKMLGLMPYLLYFWKWYLVLP
jgi:hypothetical protein